MKIHTLYEGTSDELIAHFQKIFNAPINLPFENQVNSIVPIPGIGVGKIFHTVVDVVTPGFDFKATLKGEYIRIIEKD